MATVRHLVSGMARAKRGEEVRSVAEEHFDDAGCILLSCVVRACVSKGAWYWCWTWMQDRQSCRRSACLVPLRKVCIDLQVGWEEVEAQRSIISKAVAVPAHLSFLPFWGGFLAGMCLCSCVWRWVYHFSFHLPLSLLLPLHCSVLLLGCLSACSHTHTHAHTLVASHSPPRRFLRLCLLPSDAGTDNICSNPLSSSYFLYSSPASSLLFIHFTPLCINVQPLMVYTGQPSFFLKNSHIQNAVWTLPSLWKLNCSFSSVYLYWATSLIVICIQLVSRHVTLLPHSEPCSSRLYVLSLHHTAEESTVWIRLNFTPAHLSKDKSVWSHFRVFIQFENQHVAQPWLCCASEKSLGGTRTGSVEGGAALETALSLACDVLCLPAKVCAIGCSLALSTAAAVVKNYPFSCCLVSPFFFFFHINNSVP